MLYVRDTCDVEKTVTRNLIIACGYTEKPESGVQFHNRNRCWTWTVRIMHCMYLCNLFPSPRNSCGALRGHGD